jgi:hypothetical protein
VTNILVDLVAVVLTLMVLSRIIGDNPLFRIAQYLFVGVSLGYAFVVVYHQVLRIAVIQSLQSLDDPLLVAGRMTPFLLGVLLLPRILGRQRLSWLANIPLGLIFGVGAAVALSGALMGTLLMQVLDTTRIPLTGTPQDIVGAVLLAVGVLLVLSYFYFTRPEKGPFLRVSVMSAQMGRWLLMVAFGFFLAGALITYLTALSDRLEFLINWVKGLF